MTWSASSVRWARCDEGESLIVAYDESSITWLIIRKVLWVGKRLFSAWLSISPVCIRCGDMKESIEYAFFHCPVVRLLCKLLEGYMVRTLNGRFFVLEASSVCSNVVPSLNRSEQYVFLCLLGVLRVGIWTTQLSEFREGESFSSRTLVSFYKHQIKVKIRSERKRLSSQGFGERWVTVACMFRVIGASLIFTLDIPELKNFEYFEKTWQPSPGKLD